MKTTYDRTENYLKSIKSIGQLVGEAIQKITQDKIIVKAGRGSISIVGCRSNIEKQKLTPGIRISLEMTKYTIMRMRILPREADPNLHNMLSEDPGDVKYSDVCGLNNQNRDIRQTV